MRLISHRGNINGVEKELENTINYIDKANSVGYDVEIDVWYDNGFWLGHDEPQHPVTLEWLLNRSEFLWIHCKNFQALHMLINIDGLTVFFHEQEKHTIISNGLIWSHDITVANNKCVVPLLSKDDIISWSPKHEVFGVCSDFIELLNG